MPPYITYINTLINSNKSYSLIRRIIYIFGTNWTTYKDYNYVSILFKSKLW